MKAKMDVRHQFEIVLIRAREMARALSELPQNDAELKEGLSRLSPTERQQMAEHVTALAQTLGNIRERLLYLKRQL